MMPLATGKHGMRGALFNDQAHLYAAFRPKYPQTLFERIWEFADNPASGSGNSTAPLGHELAVDVATGTGQVAAVLSERYTRVIACDSSPGQLEHAIQRPGIEYILSPAESLTQHVPAASADIITVAQAFHWFDHARFYDEARRMLKPGGTLAVWGYQLEHFEASDVQQDSGALQAATELLQDWCYRRLEPYWDPAREHLDRGYVGLDPTASQFGTVLREMHRMEHVMSLDQYMGHLSSWSSYTTWRKAHPDTEDPLIELRHRLRKLLGVKDDTVPSLCVVWPVPLLLIKDPIQ